MRKTTNWSLTKAACYVGYITQAITIILIPLFFVIFQEDYVISRTAIGNLVLITFVVQIGVDLLSILFVPKIGYRACAVLAHVFAVAGLSLLGILPRFVQAERMYPVILVCCFFYASGSGLVEVIISPIIDAIPGDAKAASMSLLHSFYSWGAFLVVLITTPLLVIFGRERWFLLPILWAIVPLVNLILFCVVPVPEPGRETKTPCAAEDAGNPLAGGGLLFFFIVVMICSGSSEQSVAQWASLFAEKALGVSKTVGDLIGPCGFAFMMALGRMGYGFFGKRLNIRRALIACTALTVLCYALTIFSPYPVPALIGCAFCGLGTSLMWPGTLAVASASFPTGKSALFSTLAFAGDVGCAAGPWISGFVSDAVAGRSVVLPLLTGDAEQIAIKTGMLAASVFPVLLLILLLAFRAPSSVRTTETVE